MQQLDTIDDHSAQDHPRDTMTTIGVVGLGAMGGRIAGRLLAQGHTVHGTNRTRAKADPLIAQGLSGATPRGRRRRAPTS